MKKLLALFVVVVAAVCVTASVAVADPGNDVATVQFTATYDYLGPTSTCKGQRIVTGGANASVRDRETCRISGQILPEGKFTIVAPGTADFLTTIYWYSDYEYSVYPGGVVRYAVSGTVVVKNRPDGTSVWEIHATY